MTRQKQVEITDEIVAQIEHVTKTTIDRDNIVVFEAAALSTKPLHKPGSIYHDARPTRGMLQAMAEALNSGEESVPLHTLHLQGGEIPKGRVFRAGLHDEIDGTVTLKAMFYLPLAEKDLIQKINLAILDEVSVGVKAKQALCSKCGFDYFGADADFTNLWEKTCANGHTLGEDDTHLKLEGLDKWMELSLVSRGASSQPKILSRTKQLITKDEYDRMAADGTPLEALVLFTATMMESPVSKTPEELAAEAATAEAEAATLEAAAAEAPAFDAQTAIEALQTQLAPMIAKFTADNESEPSAEPTVESLTTELEATQAELAELKLEKAAEEDPVEPVAPAAVVIPVGGVAASAVEDASKGDQPILQASAFKTKRNR